MKKSSLRDLPYYRSESVEVSAKRYNRVRLALRRLENPIRLSIPGLTNIDLLLDDDSWVAVDQGQNDFPVLAFTDFETLERSALHTPVRCRLYLYRANAELMLTRIMQAMYRLLQARLGRPPGVAGTRIALLPARRR